MQMESRERRARIPESDSEAQAHLSHGALKRLHPHSLRSRRVQVEPADSLPAADCRGTRKTYQMINCFCNPKSEERATSVARPNPGPGAPIPLVPQSLSPLVPQSLSPLVPSPSVPAFSHRRNHRNRLRRQRQRLLPQRLKQHARQIPLAEVRQHHNNQLPGILRPCSHLQRGSQCGS